MTSSCITTIDGSEIWMKDKQLHRDDGPAIYRTRDNYIAYYLHGKEYSFKDWFFRSGQHHMTPKQVTFMILKYGLKEI
jgi:hypothetical protein